MVKVNVSQTQFSLSIAISVALTTNLRKLNFSQISPRMSESFEYVGPAVHVTTVRPLTVVRRDQERILKARTKLTLTYVQLKF